LFAAILYLLEKSIQFLFGKILNGLKRMKFNKLITLPGVVLTGLLAFNAQAASISYYLDLSNDLPDGINYAQVTISDSATVAGDIDFEVEVLSSAFTVTGNNFGMQSFSFNFEPGLAIEAANIIVNDPVSWSVSSGKNAGGGFGKYDFQLSGNGSSRTELLTFSISGVAGDSIDSYAVLSSLNPASTEFFAAHIAGFDLTNYVTSAKFAGSTVVPVPAAAWLFGSGLLGLVAVARRRREQA
jgi:hypothetical protein